MFGSPPPESTTGSISDLQLGEGSASPFLSGASAGPLQTASGAGVVGEVSEAPPALLPFLLSPPAASAAAGIVHGVGREQAEQMGPAKKEGGQTVGGSLGMFRPPPLVPPSAALIGPPPLSSPPFSSP